MGMARKPGRPRVGEEILSRERILATALQLVDRDGVEKLTMRRLATALGVDPMALYRHLPDKAALIRGMVELVLGNFELPPATTNKAEGDWRGQIRMYAAMYRALVRTHPNLIFYLVTHIEASTPAVLAVGEYLAGVLRRAGLSPMQTITASNLIVDYLHGYALSESSGQLGQPGQFNDLYAALGALPPDYYPAMRWAYGALDEATLQAHAEDGFELILTGIATWLGEDER
jgi:AcrR family transcriptional regulator